jgi:hypothetical protein
MGLARQESIVPVLYDSVNGLTLYHVVSDGEAVNFRDWMPYNNKRISELDQEDQEVRYVQRGAITGSILGALAFIGGIALMALVFQLAYQMFHVPPTTWIQPDSKKPLDITQAAAGLGTVIIRILLLLVMAVIGGLIANRGVHLYADSRHSMKSVVIREKKKKKKKRVDEPATYSEEEDNTQPS